MGLLALVNDERDAVALLNAYGLLIAVMTVWGSMFAPKIVMCMQGLGDQVSMTNSSAATGTAAGAAGATSIGAGGLVNVAPAGGLVNVAPAPSDEIESRRSFSGGGSVEEIRLLSEEKKALEGRAELAEEKAKKYEDLLKEFCPDVWKKTQQEEMKSP